MNFETSDPLAPLLHKIFYPKDGKIYITTTETKVNLKVTLRDKSEVYVSFLFYHFNYTGTSRFKGLVFHCTIILYDTVKTHNVEHTKLNEKVCIKKEEVCSVIYTKGLSISSKQHILSKQTPLFTQSDIRLH